MRKFKIITKKLNEVFLSPNDSYHIEKVLRAKEKKLIICYDDFFEYECEIKKNPFTLKIKTEKPTTTTKCYNINAYVGIIKKKNFELVVKMLNELNVLSITPVYFERSQKSTKLDSLRLEKIIENSCKQSERKIPIILNKSIFFEDLQKNKLDGINISASMDTNSCEIKINFSPEVIYNLFIGPEGGFTKNENIWLSSNAIKIKINNSILKTETATCALTSIIIFKILEKQKEV